MLIVWIVISSANYILDQDPSRDDGSIEISMASTAFNLSVLFSSKSEGPALSIDGEQ